MPSTLAETVGWSRAAVGVALIAAPGRLLRLSNREAVTGASVLLMRTIGIRDLVLGGGTVRAARHGTAPELARWASAGLASDSLDFVASVTAMRAIGRVASAGAAGAALVFALADTVALRAVRGAPRLEALQIGDRDSTEDRLRPTS